MTHPRPPSKMGGRWEACLSVAVSPGALKNESPPGCIQDYAATRWDVTRRAFLWMVRMERHIKDIVADRRPYREKLRDPRWQKKRLARLEASDWACDCCGDQGSELQVHHRWYLKDHEPWDYELHQLETLCDRCHETVTVYQNFLRKLLSCCDHESIQELCQVARYAVASKRPRPIRMERSRKNENNEFGFSYRVASCFAFAAVSSPMLVYRVRSLVDHKGCLEVDSFVPLTPQEEHSLRAAWEAQYEYEIVFRSDADEPGVVKPA